MRLQVMDFVRTVRPVWLSQIPKGRNETVSVLAPDARYVLREAGLLADPPALDVVAWWDELAQDARSERTGLLCEAGRIGERLSMAYEQARTGHWPTWISVESNLAGYDLLSRKDAHSDDRLPIEVKASSQRLDAALIHVSANEWNVAETARLHAFHLWILRDPVHLAVITSSELRLHVPTNQQNGRWESFSLPMAVFSSSFRNVAAEVRLRPSEMGGVAAAGVVDNREIPVS
jgi:hypothetical protein